MCLLAVPSCRPLKQYIEYDVGPNRITKYPAYVGTGDSLLLRITNRVYADQYAATVVGETLTELVSPAVAGAAAVKKMTDAILPSELLKAAPAPADTGAGGEPLIESTLEMRGLSLGSQIDRASVHVDRLAISPDSLRARAERAALLAKIDSAFAERERIRVTSCSRALDRLAEHILARPGHAALLAFMLDAEAEALARNVASDPFPSLVGDAARYLESAGKHQLDSIWMRRLVDSVPSYARKLQLLALHLASDAGAAAPDTVFSKLLFEVRTCDAPLNAADAALRLTVAQAKVKLIELNRRARDKKVDMTPLPTTPIDKPTPRIVAGVDLARFALMTPQELSKLETFFGNLAIVSQRTFRAVAALNALPRYTSYEAKEVRPLAAYYAPTRVTVTITRSERVGRFAIVPAVAVAPAPPAAGGKTEAQPQDTPPAKGKEPSAPAPAPSPVPGAATPGLQEPVPLTPNGQPLPTVKIDVLERYRYRFTVGLTRSWMDARTYEVKNDTLRETGLAPTQLFPTASLSVAVYPLRGQFLATQANAWEPWTWKTLPERMGLWAQLGLSLTDPTKHIFVGASTGPFPGVSLAVGQHIGYVEKPTVRVDSEVPASSAAIRKEWDRAWAASVTVDASVILSTFGLLLGLK